MQKIIIVIITIISAVLLTGCGKETEEEIKNKKTSTEINDKVSSIEIENSKIFEGLDILNDNTLETQIGINRDYVEKHAIGISMYGNTKKLYENALKEEYNGYYVYIVSDNNEEVFNKIIEYLK